MNLTIVIYIDSNRQETNKKKQKNKQIEKKRVWNFDYNKKKIKR